MIVAVDVGNTSVSMGVIRDGDVTSSSHRPTAAMAVGDNAESFLDGLLQDHRASLPDVTQLVVASVVPSVTARLSALAEQRGIELLVADHTNVPLAVLVDQPAGVGDDRLVNALAASRLYGRPAIVVDLGTATTFDVVAADGSFVGGAIAAGAALGLGALASQTAQLPSVPLVMPPRAIGRDTAGAMQSGAVIGHIGLVAELVRAIAAELAFDGTDRPKVVLTGGLSNSDWASAIPGVDAVDPLLTLRGLAIVHTETARLASAVSQSVA